MKQKLISRKKPRRNSLERQQLEEDSVHLIARIPGTNAGKWSIPASSFKCCFCCRQYLRRNPRQPAFVVLTITLMSMLNGVRISIPWHRNYKEGIHFSRYNRKERMGSRVHPRLVQLKAEKLSELQMMDPKCDHNNSPRNLEIQLPKWTLMMKVKENEDSREFEYELSDPFETKECKAQYPWQLATYPTCNHLHEMDVTYVTSIDSLSNSGKQKPSPISRLKYLAHGYWRDIWTVTELDSTDSRSTQDRQHELYYKVVLKTMRYNHDFIGRNYDRHRRDALAAERLTRSKAVVDIYGYCGNSGIFEYGEGGDITHAIWPEDGRNLTQLEKLSIATQAATGIADFHNIDKEGQASMAHTDISPGQFIKVGETYKLNDFNRARFLRWDVAKDKPCGYYVGINPGWNRSPEEYSHKLQSEKVDVYSFGNILYMLLQKDWPFREVDEKEAKKLIRKGYRPSFDAAVWNSTDHIDMVLKEAMIMCHEQEAKDRASSREVEIFLKQHLQNFSGGQVD